MLDAQAQMMTHAIYTMLGNGTYLHAHMRRPLRRVSNSAVTRLMSVVETESESRTAVPTVSHSCCSFATPSNSLQ